MNKIAKQALVLALLLGIVAVGQFVLWPRLQSSPTKVVQKFLDSAPEVTEYVTAADAQVLATQPATLKMVDLPTQALQVTSEVFLSETVAKVDGQAEKFYSFQVVKENGAWKVSLNLLKISQIQELLQALENPDKSDNEKLAARLQLQELQPSEENTAAIQTLQAQIEAHDFKEKYKSKIQIHLDSLKKGVLTGVIGNLGEKPVSMIKGNLQFAQPSGEIIEEHEVVLYEQVPGSLVFGEAIPAQYQKKFGLNLDSIVLPKKAVVTFEVTDLTFGN